MMAFVEVDIQVIFGHMDGTHWSIGGGHHKCTHLFAFEFVYSQHVTYKAIFYSQPHVTQFQYNVTFSEQVL
jgi:hypothetical protein